MVKIAMWSGPRNLSTAMMYAFAARGDCAVWDEPFYAAYLAASGSDHPLATEIIAAHEADPGRVAALCAGAPPDGADHWYMKHMPHHMVESVPLDWAEGCVNVHLIRHPARVIASYAEKRDDLSVRDIGYPQQHRIWEALPGPIIDSADIRANPKAALQRLCAEIGVPWRESMLHWQAGTKPYDGVWARHWYNAVHRSTGFAGAEGDLPEIAPERAPVLTDALPYFEQMKAAALRV